MADIRMNVNETLELDYLVEQVSDNTIDVTNEPSSGTMSVDYINTRTGVLTPSTTGTYKVEIDGQVIEIRVTNIPDSVVSRWKFENKSDSTTVTDTVGSNDGSVNGVSYSTDSKQGSYSIMGSESDYVDTNWKGPFDADTFSIAVWIKASSLSEPNSVIDNYNGSFPQVSVQYNSNIKGLTFRLKESGSENSVGFSSFSVGSWVHVVAVRDGSEARIYKNGSLVDSNSNASLSSDLKNGDLWIGNRPDNINGWDGFIDDVMIGDVAWTDTEVSNIYSMY